jgi:hypothetical protein
MIMSSTAQYIYTHDVPRVDVVAVGAFVTTKAVSVVMLVAIRNNREVNRIIIIMLFFSVKE